MYKILDTDKKATKQEIKKAYRNKAKTCHPDVGGKEGEFALISKAYELIKEYGYDVQNELSRDDFRSILRNY